MLQRKKFVPRSFDQEYLPIAGVAQTLGISERLAHSLIHDKTDPIPHFRIGNKLIRVRKSDLHAWMENRKVDPNFNVDRIVEEVLG